MDDEKSWYIQNVLIPNNINLSDKKFAITSNGTTSAYLALHAINSENSLHSLVFTPVYFTYLKVLEHLKATIDYYSTNILNKTLNINFKEIEEIIVNKKINIIIINDPFFGTGIRFGLKNYEKLLELCQIYSVWLIVDYIYGGMEWDSPISVINANLLNLLRKYTKAILLESISKRLFINGIKSSIIYAEDTIIDRIEAASVYITGAVCYSQSALFKEIYDLKNLEVILSIIKRNIGYAKTNYELLHSIFLHTDFVLSNCTSGYYCILGIPYYRLENKKSFEAAEKILEETNILTIPHDRYLCFSDHLYCFRVNLTGDNVKLVESAEKLLNTYFN